ncbi:hypothetical protein GCM10010191_05980 [Actinomadura vinacea]|uniref:Protein kinase domain-containing protein n=1 Tax=Actinomadura vinacea TaxID=115336 RepID=A0ABN3IEI6_9ACTN
MEPGLRLTERYRLVERLDGGATREVWRAWDEALNRPVAVRHARTKERVVGAVRITHPAFVTIYDCDRTRNGDGRLVSYVVTAYLDGETLAERVAREPLPLPEALECCAQVAAGLAAAHAAGVTHGDLRPEKVFLTLDGVRIVDLGMADGAPADTAAVEEEKAADVLALGTLLAVCLPESGPADGEAAPERPEEVARLASRCRSSDPAQRPTATAAAAILASAQEKFPLPPRDPVPPAGGSAAPFAATTVLVPEGAMPPGRPQERRLPAPDGDGKGPVFRVAVTVTLAAVALAAVLVIADGGSDQQGAAPGQGRSAAPLPPPTPAPAPTDAAPTGAQPQTGPPAPAPSVIETLGRLQPIVDSGQASGAIRSDVAVDLNNLITNLRNDLASGRTADTQLKLVQLREKIATRLRERALDDDVAARMTDVLSSAAAP